MTVGVAFDPHDWTPTPLMSLVATTPPAGYTLVNGTGPVLTWNVPNDGALHVALILCTLTVTSGETGGVIAVAAGWKSPSGGSAAGATTLIPGGQAAGTSGQPNGQCSTFVVGSGSQFVISQTTALTAGAAIAWIQIWGA
jgi:hypothetical protein